MYTDIKLSLIFIFKQQNTVDSWKMQELGALTIRIVENSSILYNHYSIFKVKQSQIQPIIQRVEYLLKKIA